MAKRSQFILANRVKLISNSRQVVIRVCEYLLRDIIQSHTRINGVDWDLLLFAFCTRIICKMCQQKSIK